MIAEIDHLILPVNDVIESVDFYTSVLGFADDGPSPPFSVVRASPTFTVQLAPWGTEGNVHLAFALTEPDFELTFARIRAAGVPFGDSFHEADNRRGPIAEDGARGPGKAIYVLDPNRHLIELRYYDGNRD